MRLFWRSQPTAALLTHSLLSTSLPVSWRLEILTFAVSLRTERHNEPAICNSDTTGTGVKKSVEIGSCSNSVSCCRGSMGLSGNWVFFARRTQRRSCCYCYCIHGTSLDCLEFDGGDMHVLLGYMPIYLPGVVSLLRGVDYLWQLLYRMNDLAGDLDDCD